MQEWESTRPHCHHDCSYVPDDTYAEAYMSRALDSYALLRKIQLSSIVAAAGRMEHQDTDHTYGYRSSTGAGRRCDGTWQALHSLIRCWKIYTTQLQCNGTWCLFHVDRPGKGSSVDMVMSARTYRELTSYRLASGSVPCHVAKLVGFYSCRSMVHLCDWSPGYNDVRIQCSGSDRCVKIGDG